MDRKSQGEMMKPVRQVLDSQIEVDSALPEQSGIGPKDGTDGDEGEFADLLDASSLGSPQVRALGEEIPDDAQRRLRASIAKYSERRRK
ncbi:hypothetical protein ABT282_07330 [Streptomyces sp. NPDC000927]|uniref:hypothetical protein n=1 Tax=Streptomyces sp. NPDC000927 TaxID=3154371 RepID=UPI003327008D